MPAKAIVSDIAYGGTATMAAGVALASAPSDVPPWVSGLIVVAMGIVGGIVREWVQARERARERRQAREDLEYEREMQALRAKQVEADKEN